MGWVKDLRSIVPTAKGSSYFFYVASHWGRISAELEEYRRQVQDQKEWREENEKLLTELHNRKTEIMREDLQREMEQKAVIEEKAKESERMANLALDFYSQAVFHIAVMEFLYPSQGQSEGKLLDPFIRKNVEKNKERLKTRLSPPPPLPILPPIFSGLGLGGLLNIVPEDPERAKRLEKVGVKPLSGDPKDPNKEKR